jgi:hypothetical protein
MRSCLISGSCAFVQSDSLLYQAEYLQEIADNSAVYCRFRERELGIIRSR